MNDTQRALWSERAAITAAWVAGILMFFPIFWMALTSFKTELEAIAVPPTIIFDPTLENFSLIQERTDYTGFAWNSIITSVGGDGVGVGNSGTRGVCDGIFFRVAAPRTFCSGCFRPRCCRPSAY